MTGKEAFGVVVRTIGLLLVFWGLITAIDMVLGAPIDYLNGRGSYVMVSAVCVVSGAFIVGNANAIVWLCYLGGLQ
jgi:hypothetical protein